MTTSNSTPAVESGHEAGERPATRPDVTPEAVKAAVQLLYDAFERMAPKIPANPEPQDGEPFNAYEADDRAATWENYGKDFTDGYVAWSSIHHVNRVSRHSHRTAEVK